MNSGNFFRAGNIFYELIKGIIIFIIIIVLIHFFIATIFKVEGVSMEPNFHQDQYVVVDKISYIISKPQRGDVVILKFPGDPEKTKYIKRIIGLPGEKITILNNKIYINDQLLREVYLPIGRPTRPEMSQVLGQDEYFVVGDNRENSNDSRVWGTASKKYLIGKAIFYLYPWQYWGAIAKVYY